MPSTEAAPRTFLQMTPDQQHAYLRAQRMQVTADEIEDFHDAWSQATRDHMGRYRVVGIVPFVGEFSFDRHHQLECLLEDGLCRRPATASERFEVDTAIRGGSLQVELRKGAGGLLGPTLTLMVLHQATGRFRPFNYRYQLPDSLGGSYQACAADIEGRQRAD
ncbi:MAG: hypothetical protein ABF296_11470 [Oceanococcaceae bacterium]|jgi:hypothetical protein